MGDSVAVMTFAALTELGFLEIGDGYRAKLTELGGAGPYFLRAASLTDSGFDWRGLDRFVEDVDGRIANKIGKVGDTVITTKGNSIGRVGRVPHDAPSFVYSPHLSYWRSLDGAKIDPRFLYYWSRSNEFRNQLRAMAHSTDMAPYLSLADQRRLTIFLPSIAQQRAIGSVLEVLDKKIALNDVIASTADRLAELHFRKAIEKANLVPLSSVATPILGGTPDRRRPEYWGDGYLWASAKDVVSSKFGCLMDTAETITGDAVANTRVKPLPAGTVLLTARGTVGTVARVAQSTAVNQSCYAFMPNELTPSILYFTIKHASSQMLGIAHGTVFSTVNMKTFDHVEVPTLPTVAANKQIEDVCGPLLRTVEVRLHESNILAKLRDAALLGLMSGQMHLKDGEVIEEGAC